MGGNAAGQPEACVYLSLGSNLGDRRANLETALELLGQMPGLRITGVSRRYRTAPLGVAQQPEFLNLAAQARTSLAPGELLRAAKRIERAVGRTAGPRWGPRVIDIDILLYNAVRMETPELTLPHPRMEERAFVMAPLAEIAPDLVMPSGRLAAEVADVLRREQDVDADV
jgi:2-amino-4-hydroxy-6-hydroxymethyldihydropteridine diphosphokinase